MISPSFFFSSRRRHTRSLRDWSSDVCSSDLCQDIGHMPGTTTVAKALVRLGVQGLVVPVQLYPGQILRSEERRVGKECRSRWSPGHEIKKSYDSCGEASLIA